MNYNYTVIDPSSTLSEKQVAKSVKLLRYMFFDACKAYKSKNANVVTHFRRNADLEPVIPENADTTIFEAQVEFSYLIDEIQRGPIFGVTDYIKQCNDLIDSISK